MTSTPQNRKRKRISKNKKKGWKISDIQDIEEHLDDIRDQELTGGIVADKPDDALFFVDTAIEDKVKEVPAKKKRTTRPLKCHALLEPDPKIKPAKVKQNVKQNLLKKRCTAIQEKQKNGILSKTEKLAASHRSAAHQRRSKRTKLDAELPTVNTDIWGSDDKVEDIAMHYMNTTKQRRIPRPAHHKVKPSGLPAIAAPHPGTSYNPAYNEHQDLLERAVAVEEKKEKELLKIKRALDDHFPTGHNAPKMIQAEWIKEMSHGLGSSEDEDDEDKPEDDDRLSNNPPTRREDKKTERQRKKEKDRKNAEKEAAVVKVLKKKQNEIFRLKGIKRELRAQEGLESDRKKRKEEKQEAEKDKTKKLGSLRYQEPDLELKLSEELRGSLRELKPEGHLVKDRISSLQKRNIIEPRKRMKREIRYKRKYYVKRTHRNVV